MARLLLRLGVFAAVVGSTPAPSSAQPTPLGDAAALEHTFQDAIKKAEPSVVCVMVWRSNDLSRYENPERSDFVPESYGSGVIIDEAGLVLTHYHVIRDQTRLLARLPGGKAMDLSVVAADPRCDLAVLRLGTDGRYPAVKLGDGDHLQKGQLILTIANPFAAGFQDGSPSASWGIISNLRRRAPGKPPETESDATRWKLHHLGTLIQTDARLNLGCSGGAVINLKGELVGLTTAQAALTGGETAGGFAIPMTAVMKRIVGVLKEGKEVEYGFLGVRFDRRGFQQQVNGVRLGLIIPGSPAARAGLQSGDTVTAVEGIPIRQNSDLLLSINSMLAGTRVEMEVTRAGQRFGGPTEKVYVTLGKYYRPSAGTVTNKPEPVKGIRVDYTSVLAQKAVSDEGIPQGVYVREVLPGSPAERERLQDAVITHVNGTPVRDPAEFYREAEKGPGPLELTLQNRDEQGNPRKVKFD